MGSVVSVLLFSGLLLAFLERTQSLFVGLMLATLAVLAWFFYSDITQPLSLSF